MENSYTVSPGQRDPTEAADEYGDTPIKRPRRANRPLIDARGPSSDLALALTDDGLTANSIGSLRVNRGNIVSLCLMEVILAKKSRSIMTAVNMIPLSSPFN